MQNLKSHVASKYLLISVVNVLVIVNSSLESYWYGQIEITDHDTRSRLPSWHHLCRFFRTAELFTSVERKLKRISTISIPCSNPHYVTKWSALQWRKSEKVLLGVRGSINANWEKKKSKLPPCSRTHRQTGIGISFEFVRKCLLLGFKVVKCL